VNLRDCELGLEDDLPAGFRFSERAIRPEVGGEQIGCSVYELPPGEQLWPYHWHVNNEEWAIVVTGAATLRTPEGERELREGDVVAFVEGEAGAHTFTNASGTVARIVIFSTRRPGDAFYVDSDKIGAGPPHDRRYFRRDDAVDYWDGEKTV
jgi:uncharacterized cupin superfamily protein